MLIDHVEELEPAAVSGGVELEIHGPDLVGVFGLVTTHRPVSRPGPLLPAGSRALQPFLSPEAVHPLVIHQPAFPPEQAIRHPPAPADVLGRDLPEAPPQLGLLNVDNLGGMSLSAAVLAHHLAGEPLRDPEHDPQGHNGPAASFRA